MAGRAIYVLCMCGCIIKVLSGVKGGKADKQGIYDCVTSTFVVFLYKTEAICRYM